MRAWRPIAILAASCLSLSVSSIDLLAQPSGIVSVSSLVALKALNPPGTAAPQTVTTSGYATPGDGGGGTFDWDAASNRPADGYIVVQPNGGGTGRWVLRTEGGVVYPEQFGAKCDGHTNDQPALIAMNNAMGQAFNKSGIVQLHPGKLCLVGGDWGLPYGVTVRGAQGAPWYTPLNGATPMLPYSSGFIHPAGTRFQLSFNELENVAIIREGLPLHPTTFSEVMDQVTQWEKENGQVSAPVLVTGGKGCRVGDRIQLQAGRAVGNNAWFTVTKVDDSGAVAELGVLDPGAYQVFPKQPASTGLAFNGATTAAAHCSSFPSVTFTPGTPRSIGVVVGSYAMLRNVNVVGFNLGVYASGGNTRVREVTVDSVNGFDMTGDGGFGTFDDLVGIGAWSSTVQEARKVGPHHIISVVNGGTLNQRGDVLTVQPRDGVSCTTYPQVTVEAVDGKGVVTAAHISRYGDCGQGPHGANNGFIPTRFDNLHGGAAVAINLLWVTMAFRNGIGLYAHDQCDGCRFSNLALGGWVTGVAMSNIWATRWNNLDVEGANYSNVAPPPPGTEIANVRLDNCVAADITGIHIGGSADAELRLYQTGADHNTIPGYNCGTNDSVTGNTSAVTISQGEIAESSAPGGSKLIDIGPYTRGVLSSLNLHGTNVAGQVTIGPHVLGWILRDIAVWSSNSTHGDTFETGHWLSIDPTSVANVFVNTWPSSGTGNPISPMVIMGGLPMSPAGLPTGALWNNHGVMSIAP